jgi:hypothetical protein
MDSELKSKWLTALRGGKYRQGHGRLRTTDGRHCCLGVLCDIQGANFDEIERKYSTLSLAHNPSEFLGGISNYHLTKVSGMNDAGRSFDDIANYIEREIEPTA